MVNISELSAGARVQHDLLVYERVEKTSKTGEPYITLTLGNATGQLATAPIWLTQRAWADGADRGTFVQAIGEVDVYNQKRQIRLAGPLRILPTGLYQVEDFLPRIAGDVARLWDWIDRVRNEIGSPTLRRVLDLFFSDDEFRVRFERTPASTGGHHAKLGGLLLHVFEVISIARQTARFTATEQGSRRVDVDLVIAGALLHDIGKVEAYEIDRAGFAHTPCGLLLGHVVLGALMLERAIAKAGGKVCSDGQLLELQHMILSHHGALEFGSPVQPMTVEAEIVHWADEASAKANDMMECLNDVDVFASGGEISDRKHWRVQRRLWRRPHDWS